MEYYIGQIFENGYPPEAAIWCNSQSNCHIEEIEKTKNGFRRFKIVSTSEEELYDIEVEKVDSKRKELLEESDIWMLADRYETLDKETRSELKYYRQALRDITEQEGYPDNVVWPTKPDILK